MTNTTVKTAYLIATWFKSGLSPKAPGTVGSFCTLPLAFAMVYYFGTMGIIGAATLAFFVGWWSTKIVLETDKRSQDPGFVVIDEVVGQTLAFLLVAHLHINVWGYLLGFAFFRFFDILKPWPASYFDSKVHTAFGVMMDDVCAGLYAALLLGLVYYADSHFLMFGLFN